MSLSPGTRLGPYEVVALIGEGGMGQVYRARDTKLGRDVAVKILPDAFAADPNRTSRFDREARTLAQLNHPNIAQIYGVEERALIMELVEGEDLADRLRREPMPLPDALDIARQIAHALEAAHELGIVHRDLKPSNVKITSASAGSASHAAGMVKLLDFGLAKAIDEASTDGAATNSSAATMTSPAMTAMGMILGTAAYMSPEQARGKPTDKRADIWAFGVVLYELLTGRHLFSGETVSDVMSAVLRQEIDFSPLPRDTPPEVRRVLARCLDRDATTRLRDIGEARVALAAREGKRKKEEKEKEEGRRKKPEAWIWTTVALAIALVSMTALWLKRPAPSFPSVARFDVTLPAGTTLSTALRPTISVSPDGSTYVVASSRDGVTRLYVRRRGATETEPIPGTEGASNPVISPDGKSVAFFADNLLKNAVFDGPVAVLTAGLNDPRGLTWVDSATLVYGPNATDGLRMIKLGGDPPQAFTTLDTARNERTHRWPVAIAGGRAVAFTVGTMESPDDYENARIEAAIVATKERKTDVYRGASFIVGTTGEYLIASRGGSLHAIPFDADQLKATGLPTAVVQGVAGDLTTGAAHAAIAGDGTLLYVTGDVRYGLSRRLAWVDAAGTMTNAPGVSDNTYNDIRMSPDGTKVAMTIGTTGTGDIWVYEIARATLTRLTYTSVNGSPVWSSDSRMIYYSAIESSGVKSVIWRRVADGSREPEQLTSVPARANPSAVEANSVIVDYYGDKTDIVRVPFAAGAPVEKLVATQFDEYAGTLSPDGRWLAYQSDESGHPEVYVRDLSPGGARHQISNGFGEEPKWAADMKTIYYRADELLMAVPLESGKTLVAGKPKLFYKGVYNLRTDTGVSFALSNDKHAPRVLMIRPAVERQTPPTLRVILNWPGELARVLKK